MVTHVQCSTVKKYPFYVIFWTSLIPHLDIRVAPWGKNSKIGGFVSTAKSKKLEVLRSFKEKYYYLYLIFQNRRFCIGLFCAKTTKSEVLRPPQKLQNRRFCVVVKTLFIILNTPKSEVLRILPKNSKIGGFAPTAKTPKSDKCRRGCVVVKILLNTPKSEVLRILRENSKIGGSQWRSKGLPGWASRPPPPQRQNEEENE